MDGGGWKDGYAWSADGTRLHYRDRPGPAGAPTLLCLPGLTRNMRDFEGLASRLAGRFRILSLSLRGRGESGQAKDPLSYTPLTYVQDVVGLLDGLGMARVVAVGTSLGGIVTMLLAATAPERLGAAILNDVGPEIEPAGLERIRGYVGRGGSWPTWVHAARAIADQQRDVHPDYALADWLAMAKRLMRLDPAGRIVFDYDMRIAEPFRLPGGDAGVDLWPTLDALAPLPVLLVRGQHSDLLSEAVAERMLARLPASRLVTVPGVGHAPTLDEPEAVAAIDAFLGELPPEPAPAPNA